MNSPEQIADCDGENKPLRPLTSLKWPYVPEPPAYADPLERDDPKPLQLRQYEAIGSVLSFLQLNHSCQLRLLPCDKF